MMELVLVIALIAVFTAFALPTYKTYVDRTKVSRVVTDFGNIELAIAKYRLSNNDDLPPDLATIGMGNLRDPWNQDYFYRPYNVVANQGQIRKDRNLHPLNSDYDLFSAGEDGDWRPPLTARPSRDDVVRASDGHFIGLAQDY